MFVTIASARVSDRNVARLKPAKQSSTYQTAYAWKAVDENTSPSISPSCNLAEIHSWWAVDLMDRFLVQDVVVQTHNRLGKLGLYTVGHD